MSWEELSEKLRDERIKKGLSLKELSTKTNISIYKLKKMEEGDFSIESPIYMKNYLKRIAIVLGLNELELIEEYQSEKLPSPHEERNEIKISSNVICYTIIVTLIVLVGVLLFKIEKEFKLPYATLYNTSESILLIDGKELPPNKEYDIFKNIKVTSNQGMVMIKEYSGRTLKIKIRNFEVSLYGKGKKP
ncbi:MAG: helix-turn-helix domain-containing protein [Thermotogaceae bacterium]|nr:helix-turn-helix domain-containing protein [Thermotogaceae bacterium]